MFIISWLNLNHHKNVEINLSCNYFSGIITFVLRNLLFKVATKYIKNLLLHASIMFFALHCKFYNLPKLPTRKLIIPWNYILGVLRTT